MSWMSPVICSASNSGVKGICNLQCLLLLASRIEKNIRKEETLVTTALWPYLILCATLIFMHLVAPPLKQSAEDRNIFEITLLHKLSTQVFHQHLYLTCGKTVSHGSKREVIVNRAKRHYRNDRLAWKSRNGCLQSAILRWQCSVCPLAVLIPTEQYLMKCNNS